MHFFNIVQKLGDDKYFFSFQVRLNFLIKHVCFFFTKMQDPMLLIFSHVIFSIQYGENKLMKFFLYCTKVG